MSTMNFLDQLRSDPEVFIRALWTDRGLGKVAPLGAIEMDIVRWGIGPGNPHYRGILAPRGLGKTTLVVAAGTCYRLLRDPHREILIVSKSEQQARKTIKLIRGWIESVPFLQHLRPRLGQRDNVTMFDVGPAKNKGSDRSASVTVIGIEGMLEGNRAHTIFPDDIETKKNTETVEARDQLDERVREFSSILYPNRPAADGGPVDAVEIVYVGTRHHEDSVYDKLAGRNYHFRTWTLAYPTEDERKKIVGLSPLIADRLESGVSVPGTPTMPHRFGSEFVSTRRAEGVHYFNEQYQLLRQLGDDSIYPLRLSDLIVYAVPRGRVPVNVMWAEADNHGSTAIEDIPMLGLPGDRLRRPAQIDKLWMPFTGVKAFVDPAGRGKDLTGLSIIGHLAGMLWVPVCRGLPGGASDDHLDRVLELCRDWNVRELFYESNIDTFDTFGDVMRRAVTRWAIPAGANDQYPDGWSCSVIPRHRTGMKEQRICDAIQNPLSTHRIVMDPANLRPDHALEPHQQLQYQFTRITRQRKCLQEDGALDSLASCLAEWKHVLATDPRRAAQSRHDLELEKAMRHLSTTPAAGNRMFTHRHFG